MELRHYELNSNVYLVAALLNTKYLQKSENNNSEIKKGCEVDDDDLFYMSHKVDECYEHLNEELETFSIKLRKEKEKFLLLIDEKNYISISTRRFWYEHQHQLKILSKLAYYCQFQLLVLLSNAFSAYAALFVKNDVVI